MPRYGRYAAYAITITLSAFLIFAVQPIAGKYLLPYFGGSSSVWATSLLFFTGALFFGYAYAYALAKLRRHVQTSVHAGLIILAALYVLFLAFYSGAAYPSLEWTIGNAGIPSLNVLLALIIALGAPYVLLSTTGPLLQYWYGLTGGSEPYTLYALSNAGSLAALLLYPFAVEPYIPLLLQQKIWMCAFAVYAAAALFVALSQKRTDIAAADTHGPPRQKRGIREYAAWIGFAALPALMLVATTTRITQEIAPVPLLWIVPLALYLTTFIIAFSGRLRYALLPLLLFVSAAAAFRFDGYPVGSALPQAAAYLILLFFCGLFCHTLLYRMRPGVRELPLFYLLMSLGGMLGTFAAGIIAPLVFPDFWEFQIGVAACAILAFTSFPAGYFPRAFTARAMTLSRIVFAAFALYLLFSAVMPSKEVRISSRNFYGAASVVFSGPMTVLMHGSTFHGVQYTAKDKAVQPTSYYTVTSGVGRAIAFERSVRGKEPLAAGILGLGTGTLAAYCEKGDTYVFYEIDPRIEMLARTYFNYLSRCEGAEVRLGDGRMLLEKELRDGASGNYDVLAIDAFTDDAIPVHLLTLEAMRAYAAHLRTPQSIIAVHVSNRYLDLAPVVLRLAAEMGFNGLILNDDAISDIGSGSKWVLLAQDVDVLRSSAFSQTNPEKPDATAPIWTDDHASILPIIDFPL